MCHPIVSPIFTKVKVRYVLVFCECYLVCVSLILVSFKVTLNKNLTDFTMYTSCSRCHTDVTVHFASFIRALRLSYVSLMHCRRLAIQQTDFVLKQDTVLMMCECTFEKKNTQNFTFCLRCVTKNYCTKVNDLWYWRVSVKFVFPILVRIGQWWFKICTNNCLLCYTHVGLNVLQISRSESLKMFVEKHEAPILIPRFSRDSCGFRSNETSDKTSQNIYVACSW